jgi:hypothetical protein
MLAVATVAADQRPRQQPVPRPPTLAELGPLNAPKLLDQYLAGRFDEAVQAVRAGGDDAGRKLRQQWALFVPRGSTPTSPIAPSAVLPRRRLRSKPKISAPSAATGPDHSRSVCRPVRGELGVLAIRATGKADDTEHAWLMAAISLAEGVRDWRYLHRYVAPPAANTRPRPGTGPPPIRGLIDLALDRFPKTRPFACTRRWPRPHVSW